MIRFSSKIALKASCLEACGGDVKQAGELYAYFADGLGGLPDFEAQPPSLLQQAAEGANALAGWVKANREDLLQAWELVGRMRGGGSVPVSAGVPPAGIDPPPPPNG